MVPVRKPGRPLSACPHPRDSPCGCGSVTAAIPRKQTCHCGTGTPALSDSRPPTSSSSSDAPSPKQFTFKVGSNKVGKPSKPSSSRKQSFDPANFERMDINQINVMSFGQQPHIVALPMVNGYSVPGTPQIYGFAPQYPNFQPQFSHVSMQLPPHSTGVPQNGVGSYSSGIAANGGFENVIESPLATPTGYGIEDLDKHAKAIGVPMPNAAPEQKSPPSNGGSCCAPRKSHAHTSSSVSSGPEIPEPPVASCCSQKPSPKDKKIEESSNDTSSRSTPQPPPLVMPQNVIPFGHPMYQQYSQPTVFTYPPTYGSFQNPLQPQAWRQSVQSHDYGRPPVPLPFNAPLLAESLDTIHTCSCGDACQCIGCAAHPYNDATRNYVRSAWASMSIDRPPSEMYPQPATTNGNENTPAQSQPTETIPSPTAHTPSSTASANGEEQSLSAADFFFVNYPFAADGCGGDTQSCPCGDDCQCLGCTIHRQPPTSEGCCGEKEMCGCGDDCKCVGCEFHGNA
jgi:hypothetical protein